MLDQQPLFSKRQRIFFVGSLVFYFVLMPAAAIFQWKILAVFLLTISSIAVFISLLEMNDERVGKGIWMICFAAVCTGFPALVFKGLEAGSVLAFFVKLASDIGTFASAGAGGSIIAAHGDKYSTDAERPTGLTITSDAKRFNALKAAIKSQTSWIRNLCILVGLLDVGLFANLLRG